jgi:outer membrane protein insertion porin family
MVDKAKKRLQGLGYFKTVEIKRRPGSAPDRVILDVELVETSTGDLSFGAGYSTSEGVIGDITITERNLLGRGQYLQLRLAGSASRMQATLSFTEPRFLDRNLAAGFDLFHKTTFVSTYQPYAARNSGGSVRVGFPLAENLWLTNSYTLSNNEISDAQDTASLAIRLAQGQYWTSSVGTSLVYDQRNHPKTPTNGYYLQAGAEFAGLGGDVDYIRTSVEGRFYYPITEKITFVGRAIGGHIEGWGGQDVRLLDMFYKGGETIRGFYTSGYGPRDTLTRNALGGDTYWATTAEVRFPFPLIPDDLGMSGAIFADAGSLFGAAASAKALNTQCGQPLIVDPNTGAVLNPGVCLADSSAVRASIGFGILWNSPLGPLRLDIAKPLLKQSYDIDQIVRFGASTRF